MKNITLILLSFLFLTACEDVIDVDVPTSEPKLVIDASINWFENTSGNYQTIKLTLTTSFFDNQIPAATGAIVSVIDQNNNTYNFNDTNNNGIYECFNFNPQINETYTLNINYNNESYTATETMTSVTQIDSIQQENDGGFTGDEIEIKAYYTDPANEENYYFFEFQEETETNPYLEVYNDEFTNGNQIFAFYTNPDTQPGNQLSIKNYGISKQFYEYMFILLQQTSEGGGGPFEVQPATVRGNCTNQTNAKNYPLGYFRVSQATETTYTIQ
ncbi:MULTISPECIES: DUF4249 domain-containing protein [unclassified Lacinutrix]|uniref:DUF4249 domain-containing protein n=1 Tax=unclassified Lacinutrix TaxID=2647285 RepID=UPI00020A3D6A|nr:MULTISPECIES: DUF4249 domain-containing protein [unclassified Lacinutrix]AEG99881.1 hypothetical protein Lacal_0029 [Lacinutrix sp. 5H-3-7-4]OIQ16302.1 MAG: hypothetical protein BM549_13375 [Lacinutrix sp. MedPE-SW]